MSNENVHRDEFDLQFNKISGIKRIVFVNNLILSHGIMVPSSTLFLSYMWFPPDIQWTRIRCASEKIGNFKSNFCFRLSKALFSPSMLIIFVLFCFFF